MFFEDTGVEVYYCEMLQIFVSRLEEIIADVPEGDEEILKGRVERYIEEQASSTKAIREVRHYTFLYVQHLTGLDSQHASLCRDWEEEMKQQRSAELQEMRDKRTQL